jgi:ABC-type multidrug transport system fused ATPase/permease subunit
MKNSIRLIIINFSKPWWHIIVQQKWLASAVIISVIIRDVFWALAPFLIAFTLEKSSWYFFAIACALWLLAELNNILQPLSNTRFQLQCIHSLFYSAHEYLLTVDPKYHVKRSSGIVLAKIDRAGRGYEEVLDQITYEFAPLFIGIITMIIILSQYSIGLVIAIVVCLTAMIAYGYYFARYAYQNQENEFIKTDDDFHAAAFENLAQIQLIRATFATQYMQNKLKQKIAINSATEKKLWLSYAFSARILSVLYALSILILLGFFVHSIRCGITSLPFAIGLILAYIQSTNKIIKILQPFRRYMRGYAAIQDLFAFPIFKQADFRVHKQEPFKIEAHKILFNYNAADIFNYHSLTIQTSRDQHNKLYGIIGPSGVGKSTLLSILGGQLKPIEGNVLINSIDIYNVGDDVRRQLITLQGQTSANIKGSVRYNMLFGLPENHEYCDDYVWDILRRVGLEAVLLEHQGLDTLLGEGALNISGGQRQRLNFAGLYLRARYYKPILILIDEPTSSLDEISEIAVTTMISELASKSITLVIAHRLKTLKDAVGLIDLSLLSESKDIKVYTSDELKQYSAYYRRLLEGEVDL